jgi:hypothetical protein
VPLRPLTLGEIFDGSFQAIRTNPRTMLGISSVIMIVVAVIGLFPQFYLLMQLADFERLTTEAEQTGEFGVEVFGPLLGGLGGLMVSTLVKALATTALTALLVVAVSEAVLGRRMEPRALWRRVRPRLGAVIGLALLSMLLPGLAVALISGILVALTFAGLAVSQDAGAVVGVTSLLVGLPLVIGVIVFLWIRLCMAGPALLLENLSPIAALRRSWRLVRGSWWRLFGIQLLTSFVVGIGSGMVSVPFTQVGTLIADSAGGAAGMTFVAAALSGIGEIVTGTVFTPFSAAVTSLLYIDRRMRAEGLDVELVRAASAGLESREA